MSNFSGLDVLFGKSHDLQLIEESTKTTPKGFRFVPSEEKFYELVDNWTFHHGATQGLCRSLFWAHPDSLRKMVWVYPVLFRFAAGDAYHFRLGFIPEFINKLKSTTLMEYFRKVALIYQNSTLAGLVVYYFSVA